MTCKFMGERRKCVSMSVRCGGKKEGKLNLAMALRLKPQGFNLSFADEAHDEMRWKYSWASIEWRTMRKAWEMLVWVFRCDILWLSQLLDWVGKFEKIIWAEIDSNFSRFNWTSFAELENLQIHWGSSNHQKNFSRYSQPQSLLVSLSSLKPFCLEAITANRAITKKRKKMRKWKSSHIWK